MKYAPFVIAIPEAELKELQDRLRRTRMAPDFGNADWRYGTNGEYLRELLRYWETECDWRKQEQAINRFNHFKTTIDGMPIHFIYEKGRGPNPTPIVLSHGWPWTFWDWYKLIGPLTDPAAYGC